MSFRCLSGTIAIASPGWPTGLGLPLTKALIELHGGTLDLHSEVGKGTTVTLWFPAERIVAADREVTRPAKQARTYRS